MKRGIRVKEGEDLSEAKIAEVIELLHRDKPITKKEACSMLNIAYNPSRLNNIINEYNETIEFRNKRKKELKNEPLSKAEITEIISTYLETGNLSEITESTFRSTTVIKKVLDKYHIPLRSSEYNYFNPPLLDEDAIKDDYVKDDLVYSARYTQPALVSKKYQDEVYSIWLIIDEQYSLQPYWELADLRSVQREFGIKPETKKYWENNGPGEIQHAIEDARRNAKRRKKHE